MNENETELCGRLDSKFNVVQMVKEKIDIWLGLWNADASIVQFLLLNNSTAQKLHIMVKIY